MGRLPEAFIDHPVYYFFQIGCRRTYTSTESHRICQMPKKRWKWESERSGGQTPLEPSVQRVQADGQREVLDRLRLVKDLPGERTRQAARGSIQGCALVQPVF